jgi:Mrp family chromosome partitioning ATPase
VKGSTETTAGGTTGVPLVQESLASGFGRYLRQMFAEYITLTEVKRLITQFSILQEKQDFKIVAITSEQRAEGKTFLVLALAYGYAMLRSKRVLVVDAATQTVGGRLFMEHVLWTGVPGNGQHETYAALDILSTRSEKLAATPESSDFELIPHVRAVARNYDLVLVDTCAFSAAQKENIDPLIVATQSDAAVLVTSPRSVGAESTGRVQRHLKAWDIKLIGTIFNRGATL